MQAGNDFLPNIPSLEIYGRPSGLDILLRTYKDLLPALGGPITNGSVINPDRLKRILTKLAEDEEDAFQRLAVSPAVWTTHIHTAYKSDIYVTSAARVVSAYAKCASEQQQQRLLVIATELCLVPFPSDPPEAPHPAS